MKTINTILLMAVLAVSANGETPEHATEQFFKLYSEGKSAEAVDSYFSSNRFMERKKDSIDSVKSKLLASFSEEQFGKLISWKRLSSETLSDFLREDVYVVIYERGPVRFRFKFYNRDNVWVSFGFSFDSNLDDELETKSDRVIVKAE